MGEKIIEVRGCRLTFPGSWLAEDDGEELSLHRLEDGGAITISTYRGADPQSRADALEKCRRFVVQLGSDIGCADGSALEANAELTDRHGEKWIIQTVTRGNRFVLATYNSLHDNTSEVSEARRILASVELVE
jgi:hypothetical protein